MREFALPVSRGHMERNVFFGTAAVCLSPIAGLFWLILKSKRGAPSARRRRHCAEERGVVVGRVRSGPSFEVFLVVLVKV